MIESYAASQLRKADCGVIESQNRLSLEVLLPDGRRYFHWIKTGWNANYKGSVAIDRGIRSLVEEAGIKRGVTKKERRSKRRFGIKRKTWLWLAWINFALWIGVAAGWNLRGIL